MFVFLFTFNVLNEQNSEEVGFQEDVHQSGSHLHHSQVKYEDTPYDWEDQVVVDVGETQVLLVFVVFD